MPIAISKLLSDISPKDTVLILGAGASIPSGAPSAQDLVHTLSSKLGISPDGLTLSEIASLVEIRLGRGELIALVRSRINGLRAKGAILNLPHYDWKDIFSTNYDELLEDSYARSGKSLVAVSSNFDFTADSKLGATKLFKLHGTIRNDVSDGHQSRIIITEKDYELTNDYREALYDRLKADMSSGSQVLIVGQSLADADLREIVHRAIKINQQALRNGKIALLLYERDPSRAELFESRGIQLSFGSLDDLIATMGDNRPNHTVVWDDESDPIDVVVALRPVTYKVNEEADVSLANASAIFNGLPANYPEIVKGLTFNRTVAAETAKFLNNEDKICAVVLGASGVGKTTAARQVVLILKDQGYFAYEHKNDHPLSSEHWVTVASRLKSMQRRGVLLIDDAHSHLFDINELIDKLVASNNHSLKIISTSAKNHWGPRVKTPNIYQYGKEFPLSRLDVQEIDRLLSLVDTVPELRALVEAGFSGFSASEKRRRLADRCDADMFVCLKNIFASEKFDDIVLREFASLSADTQEIYKLVAAMEYAGVHVHRQLVVRALGISGSAVPSVLMNLDEIIYEYTVNSKEGVYGWKVRHYVIAGIISKYKFNDPDKRVELYKRVIDNISPSYDIEIRTIRELCSVDTGIPSIADKHTQNMLLRQMMSIAPGERVPRHRLIRNLIDLEEFEKAESEIRIFEKDFRKEAPIARYRVLLTIARAVHTPGLMREDRIVILEQARELVIAAADRFDSNKYVLASYCELGIEYFKLTGSHEVFDEAMKSLKKAELRLGDPDITKIIIRYQRRISGQGIVLDERPMESATQD